MKIEKIEFLGSFTSIDRCPKWILPEIALIGRSNVGKSTFINFLTNQKNLAKTSSTPGKTRQINYFRIDNRWYLVDLPGYGYAKLNATERKKINHLIHDYLLYRKGLTLLFLLIDARHPALPIDLEMCNFLGENNIPFSLILTKTDKLSKIGLQKHIKLLERNLSQHWEPLPNIFTVSSLKKTGREEVLSYIEEVISTLK